MAQDRKSRLETVAPAAASNEPGAGEQQALCQFVTCRIGQEEFALDILSVQEINRMVDVTRVPKAPPYVEGVINLRGRIVPVIDLRRRFGFPQADRTAQSRIVVVTVLGRTVGLIVDSVTEVIWMPENAMEPSPSLGSTAAAEFTKGVGRMGNRLLIMLDLHRLLIQGEPADAETVRGSA